MFLFLVRMKREHEMASDELLEKLKLMEKEKSELFAMHLHKQSDLEVERRSEIERLKEAQRF